MNETQATTCYPQVIVFNYHNARRHALYIFLVKTDRHTIETLWRMHNMPHTNMSTLNTSVQTKHTKTLMKC